MPLRSGDASPAPSAGDARTPFAAVALAVLTAVAFALQLVTVSHAAVAGGAPLPQQRSGVSELITTQFVRGLPLPVVLLSSRTVEWLHVGFVLLGAAQTALLFALYRSLGGRTAGRPERIVFALVALVMVALALTTPALASSDVYAYAGYARLGLAAGYAPPSVPFGGEFAAINRLWGMPLVPDVYGPLWAWASSAVAAVPTLHGQLLAFRWVEAAAFVVVLAELAALGFELPLLVLIALNGGLLFQYVANAHNDLVAVALVLAGLLAARARPWLAVVAVALAALIKIPFGLLGLAVFHGSGSLRRRLLAVLALGLIVVVASVAWGGSPYVHALFLRTVSQRGEGHHLSAIVSILLRLALCAIALVGLLTVFVRNIVTQAPAWSFMALGPLYPWYIGWGLPFAALSRQTLRTFAIAFPLLASVFEPEFPHSGIGTIALLGIVVFAGAEAYRGRRRGPEPVPAVPSDSA